MAARPAKKHHEDEEESEGSRPGLRTAHPAERDDDGALGDLLSGKVTREKTARKKGRKKKKPTEKLPDLMAPLGDLFAAGRKVQKELDFKIRFAEQKVKEYCLSRFAEIFAKSGTRPPSIDYQGDKSHFTFIQTARITLTLDKVEALRGMNVDIDEYTELKGLKINFEAIRSHKLESKLRSALQHMGLSKAMLEEVFEQDFELKENFFDVLDRIVKDSLQKGEDFEEKLLEVLRVLGPANQIRSPDVPGMDVAECFDLVRKTDITRLIEESDESSAA